ncbi:hypothetical protein NGRA_0740, partial [Nosema granulosis]
MRNIQISQLKGENFSLHKLIEASVVIDKEDIDSTKSSFKELIKDLETLREALFFKQEKLNIQLRTIESKIEVDKIKDLYKDLEELEVGPLGKSKEVLERNKEIYELKLINKVCRYFSEVEKGNFQVLTTLVQSDDKDDWKFLGFFIQKTMDIVEGDTKAKLSEIKTVFERRLIGVFEQGKKSRNRTIMKSSYIALSELDLEHTLIQTFIYDLDIFKGQPVLKPSKAEIIDVDFYEEEYNDFFEFINTVRNTYQEELSDLENIFPDFEKAYKIINTKLYHDLIFPTLENYLKNLNQFQYLYSLKRAYLNIVNLGNYIESIAPKFDSKLMLEEIVDRYSILALEKERIFFKEMFESLINGNKTDRKYIILGEEVGYSRNFNNITKQLLDIVSQFLERSKLLYNRDDVYDMVSFYSRYFIRLIDVVFDEKEDKVDTILQVEYVYLMVRRFFGTTFSKMHSFSSRVECLIKDSFKWKIEQVEGRIKQISDQIYFYKTESDLYLLEYLKTQVEDVRRVKGKNFAIFCKHIFRYAHEKIKKRIFDTSFGETQKVNIKIFTKNILEYVDLLGIAEIQKLFKYLANIVLILTINIADLVELVNVLKIKMEIDDIKRA